MKRIILSVALLTSLLSSGCSKTAIAPDPTGQVNALYSARAAAGAEALPASLLPENVKTYLDQNAVGYTLVKVEKTKQPGTTTYLGTKVKVLQNGVPTEYFFDTSGTLTTRPSGPRGEVVNRLTAAELPASVSSYLSQTYAGYQLVLAESVQIKGTAQEYRVQVLSNNQRIDVHFDGTGTFRDAHAAPGSLTTTHSVSYISRDNLPDSIKASLNSTYTAYTYGWAEEHSQDGTTTYDVKLFNNGQPTVLHFSTSGILVTPIGPGAGGPGPGGPKGSGPKAGVPTPPASGAMVPGVAANRQLILDATQLPSAIMSFLQTNFSNYTFLAAELHTPPMESTGTYQVDMAVGKQLYKLRFSASGELLMAEARN